LHVIAITRARVDPDTGAYLDRKEAEGKTKKGALRSLKRHLARRFYRLLMPPIESREANGLATLQTPQPRKQATTITLTAPAPMPCLK
jgi:hypothetical protein